LREVNNLKSAKESVAKGVNQQGKSNGPDLGIFRYVASAESL